MEEQNRDIKNSPAGADRWRERQTNSGEIDGHFAFHGHRNFYYTLGEGG